MKKRLLFLLPLICVGLSVSAQTESRTKQIAKIQKSKAYLWAEAVDTTEAIAYKAANNELNTRINEYIIASGMAEKAKDVVVKNVGQYTNEIKLSRAGLHRVFLFVKRSDIEESSSPVKVITIQQSAESNTEPPAPETKQQVANEEKAALPTPTPDPTQKANQPAASPFSALSKNKLQIVEQVSSAKDLKEAWKVLQACSAQGRLKDYGVKKDCKDEGGCYWIVANAGKVQVLSKMQDGKRWNYNTGQTDTLQNYTSGLWMKL